MKPSVKIVAFNIQVKAEVNRKKHTEFLNTQTLENTVNIPFRATFIEK